MYKIEGEAFERIKAVKTKSDARKLEVLKQLEELERQSKEEHKKLWDAIYAELGDLKDKKLNLDSEYESLGFYVVKEKEKTPCAAEIISQLFKD